MPGNTDAWAARGLSMHTLMAIPRLRRKELSELRARPGIFADARSGPSSDASLSPKGGICAGGVGRRGTSTRCSDLTAGIYSPRQKREEEKKIAQTC